MKTLAIIPARGGSKGLPGKNVKSLCGRPLICWTIDAIRAIFPDEDICVSTDSFSIKEIVEEHGLQVPFIRPPHLATDTATTREVLLHALDFYQKQGKDFDVIMLLQPTSPLRNTNHIKEALALYTPQIDMVVSVKKSHAACLIAQENENGFLELSFNKLTVRRQDMPEYYEYNGAIYIINVDALRNNPTLNFEKKIKYVMDDKSSLDIDNQLDLDYVELIMTKYEIL